MRLKKIKALTSCFLISLMIFSCFTNSFAAETVQYKTKKEFTEKDFLKDCEIKNITRYGAVYKPSDIRVLDTTYEDVVTKDVTLDHSEDVGSKKTIEGQEYTLKKIKEDKEVVEAYTDYEEEVTEADVPKTKTYTTYVNGLKVDTELPLESVTRKDTIRKTTNVTVTYIAYDSDYYEFNGKQIPYNPDYPEVANYKSDILQAAGIPEGEIENASWIGGEYTQNGVKQRDALITVSYPCVIYRANYKSEISKGTYQATYESFDPKGEKIYNVSYDYAYSHITQKAKVLYGCGILVVALAIAYIIVLLAKKKKKKENEEEKIIEEVKRSI